jgi:hypothetical protein
MRMVLGMTFGVALVLSFFQQPKPAPQAKIVHAAIMPAPASPDSQPPTESSSCRAKGYFRIRFSGTDTYHLSAVSAKFQLVDPHGRRLGPKFDSEEIVNDIPGGNFDWQAKGDDEDPNAPPEVPSGMIEVCSPESGVYRLEGHGMMDGDYTLDISTYSEEKRDARGLPRTKQFYRHFVPKVAAGAVHTVEIRYSRSVSKPTNVAATLQ